MSAASALILRPAASTRQRCVRNQESPRKSASTRRAGLHVDPTVTSMPSASHLPIPARFQFFQLVLLIRLVPIASGSGSIITHDGSVLTNYHVLADPKSGELYERFVIGRFVAENEEPLFVCMGKAADGVFEPNFDLALIKCDTDLTGRAYKARNWPTVNVGRSEDVAIGAQIWVIGYPNVGGGVLSVTAGLVSGWTGEQGGAGSRAFMKTDAAITHGNSGGAAIDQSGFLVGVPTAFRVSTKVTGVSSTPIGKVGLMRPIEHAQDLIARAKADPARGEARDSGVIVTGKVLRAANSEPIANAFVVVFKSGVSESEISTAKLEEQAAAWGQTNAAGEFRLQNPVARGARYRVNHLGLPTEVPVVEKARPPPQSDFEFDQL